MFNLIIAQKHKIKCIANILFKYKIKSYIHKKNIYIMHHVSVYCQAASEDGRKKIEKF